jgi:hypothetical protein
MQLKLLTSCVVVALALAACGKDDRPKTSPAASGGSTTAPQGPTSNTPTTPANIGQPRTMEEKREGANPTQQQVDPKESVQHRDFQHKGDAAGPRSAETAPRN